MHTVRWFQDFLRSCKFLHKQKVHTMDENLLLKKENKNAQRIIVTGGSGAASSNLEAANRNLSANISLLLTSASKDCNWRFPPHL